MPRRAGDMECPETRYTQLLIWITSLIAAYSLYALGWSTDMKQTAIGLIRLFKAL